LTRAAPTPAQGTHVLSARALDDGRGAGAAGHTGDAGAQGVGAQALALLDETLAGAQALKRADNRAAVRMQAADLLWPRDERRARALFRAAAADLAAGNAELRGKGFRGDLPTHWNFFYTVAARDVRLTVELLRDLRPGRRLELARGRQRPEAEVGGAALEGAYV
jgi:hypothetical protein